jgi:hypothetical protein
MDQLLDRLRDDSLSLFRTAREAEQYEVAYHALAAALHAAEAQDHPATCDVVERLANECREVVDANSTRHKLSSESAALRGHESIFKQLAVMAVSARLRMEAEHKLKGHPKVPSADGENPAR